MKKRHFFRSIMAAWVLTASLQSMPAGYPGEFPLYQGEYRQANMHLLKFQDALATQKWQDALTFCSDRVRSKASEWTSPEAFFKDTTPLGQVISQPFGCWSCGSNNYGMVIDLRDQSTPFSKLPGKSGIQWHWAVYKTNDAWVIDYPPVKLSDHITQRKAAMKARSDRISQIQKEAEAGARNTKTQLSAVSDKFIIGSPMLFRLELINFGTNSVHYENAGAGYHALSVWNELKQPVESTEKPCQIMVARGELLPGSSTNLASSIDICLNHQITTPGVYYVQFSGNGLSIGKPIPFQDVGLFHENASMWPLSFISSPSQFPSQIIRIEVTEK